MKKKFIAISILLSIVITSIFLVGVLAYATYGHIDESLQYNYKMSGNETEEISLDADICNIEINYNNTMMPTNISMIIYLEIHFEGIFLEGKTYENYFEPINTVNNSIKKDLTLRTKQNNWCDPSCWFRKGYVRLTAILRTDLKYNITCLVSTGNIILTTKEYQSFNEVSLSTSTGNINLNSKGTNFEKELLLSTITGNILLNSDDSHFLNDINIVSSTGNIYLTQNNCVMQSNLQMSVITGNINLAQNNITNNYNNTWNIITQTGNIDIIIDQGIDLGGNIEGLIMSSTGNLVIQYYDNQINTGSKFTGNVITGTKTYTNGGGFIQEGNIFRSLDFPTSQFSYDFLLQSNTGNIYIFACSS
ncbi:MAG: hypothetical protein JXA99_14925 [Candidatus Lokiarchaeota archaeon]|nr:hypothetical protein [Candidatus Lokiarchaeota archaeon]